MFKSISPEIRIFLNDVIVDILNENNLIRAEIAHEKVRVARHI